MSVVNSVVENVVEAPGPEAIADPVIGHEELLEAGCGLAAALPAKRGLEHRELAGQHDRGHQQPQSDARHRAKSSTRTGGHAAAGAWPVRCPRERIARRAAGPLPSSRAAALRA